MSLAALLDRAAAPLDAARRVTFSVTLKNSRARSLLFPRDRRIAVIATVHAFAAFVLAVFVPTLLLMLGPILFGVAHAAADVRYLVLRRRLPRSWQRMVFLFCGILVALRGLSESHLVRHSLDRIELGIAVLWVAIGLMTGSGERRDRIRAVSGALVLFVIAAAALSYPDTARLVFAQAHNVVALILWAALFRRRRRALALPLLLVTSGTLLLGSGALYGTTLHHARLSAFGVHLFQAADWIAPRVRADYGIGLTCAYAFLQSVHYVVWLHLVPQDEARGPALTSFRATGRSLLKDFGATGVVAIAVTALAVLAGAFVDAARTRGVYLSLAMFHGYLELALFAYFWGRGLDGACDHRDRG